MTSINGDYFKDNYGLCLSVSQILNNGKASVIIDNGELIESKQFLIEDPGIRKCRFCGRSCPEVTFKMKAHAIPELLGNKTIISMNECDTCNTHFSKFEDSLSKYLLLYNSIMRIKGKKGVPSYKSKDKTARIDSNDGIVNIYQQIGNDEIINLTKDNKAEISAIRQPYIPIYVYKAFVKMAISTMPYEIANYFGDTREWLLGNNPPGFFFHPKCRVTFMPKIQLGLTIFGLVRKDDVLKAPFYQFVICYGHLMFQILVPCPQKDKHLLGQTLTFERFAFPFEPGSEYEKVKFSIIDLSSKEITKDESTSIRLSYESINILD